MSRLDRAINIDDLTGLAKRRLPRMIFDFIEGGVDDELGLLTNANAFRDVRLVPRYLVDTSGRRQTATLFGRSYASPLGIAPTGMAGTFGPNTELHFARAAAEADIPYLMSGASNASMEEAAKLAPRNLWFQIYGARDRRLALDLAKRAGDCGLTTIAVTCDVPVTPNRERNRRNGFAYPPKLTLPMILQAMLHPSWVASYFRNGGLPALENWKEHARKDATPEQVADLFASQTPDASQTWRDLERIRDAWPGRLLLKGVMHPDDALMAQHLGIDGLIVSNHGARQLDRMPSALDMLPIIRAAVGPTLPLLMDSGVRRGSDIICALCLGADLVLAGRAPLYGAIAGGLEGVRKAVSILQREIDLVMGQLGATSLDMLGSHYLFDRVREDHIICGAKSRATAVRAVDRVTGGGQAEIAAGIGPAPL